MKSDLQPQPPIQNQAVPPKIDLSHFFPQQVSPCPMKQKLSQDIPPEISMPFTLALENPFWYIKISPLAASGANVNVGSWA